MVIQKYTLDLSGDSFSPKELTNRLIGQFRTDHSNEPGTPTGLNNGGTYGYGSMGLTHPQRVSLANSSGDYEAWYVDFLEKNISTIRSTCVEEIQLCVDVVYDHQCNFGLMDAELLARLSRHNVFVQISVIRVAALEIVKLIEEIGASDEQSLSYIQANKSR